MPGESRLKALLLNYPGNGIQAVRDRLAVLLVQVAVIGLRHLVGAQALTHIHRVRHGLHGAGVHCLQLIHKFDDTTKLLDHAVNFARPDLKAGEVRDLQDILAGEFHSVLGPDWIVEA